MAIADEQSAGLETFLEMAEHGIRLAEKLGASEAELFFQNGFARSVEIKNNSITGSQSQTTSGLTVRIYIGKQLGMAYTTLISPTTVEETIKKAVDLAKLSPADEDYVKLVSPADEGFIPHDYSSAGLSLFDEAITSMDPELMIDLAEHIIEGSQIEGERVIANGQVRSNFSQRLISNSLGVNSQDEGTGLVAFSFNSIPKAPTNVGTGSEFFVTRVLPKNLNLAEIGQIATERAIKTLDAQQAPTGKYPVIFDERATYQTMASIIASGVNGQSVMLGTSYFADKLGQEIAVPELNVWDDPLTVGGSQSTVIDDEGVPTRRIDFVTKGVLRSYATDSYTANKLGIELTGHARRFLNSSKPMPMIHQLQISSGTGGSLEEMLEDMKEGIFMESSVGPQGGSPNISSKINRGFFVKDGEIAFPLKNSMISSEVMSFLKDLESISKNLKIEFGHQSPSILIREMSVSGVNQTKSTPQSMLG